jgi:hypothetical protein
MQITAARGGGEVPDPGGAVACAGELADVVRAAAR